MEARILETQDPGLRRAAVDSLRCPSQGWPKTRSGVRRPAKSVFLDLSSGLLTIVQFDVFDLSLCGHVDKTLK
ncbi:hypothetical protein DUI70_2059 [Streptomyces albus]|nr:hypothetical protein DUI70_2059 [Streptomyces albus]